MRKLLGLAGAATLATCLSACSQSATPTTRPTPTAQTQPATSSTAAAQLLHSALANARKQRSLHYVSTSNGGGVAVTITGDVTATEGTQTIDYARGTATGKVIVELIGREAYFKGDAVALRGFMGLSAAQSAANAGRWISVVPSDSAFAATAAALTVGSVIDQIGLSAPLSRGGETSISGQRVLEIRGALSGPSAAPGPKGKSTLAVSASGAALPVRFGGSQTTSAGSFTEALVLSRWNEPVTVRAPSSSTPLSTIIGAGTSPQPTTAV